MNSKPIGHLLVPTLRRGNAAIDAPASRNAGALRNEFPRRSVGTREKDNGAGLEFPRRLSENANKKLSSPNSFLPSIHGAPVICPINTYYI